MNIFFRITAFVLVLAAAVFVPMKAYPETSAPDKKPVKTEIKKDGRVPSAKIVKNDKFDSELTAKIKTADGEYITLCDYSSAGKNCDDDNRTVSVWCDLAQK